MTNPGRLRIGRCFAWAKAGVALLVAFGCDAVGDGGLAGEAARGTVEETQQAAILQSNAFDDTNPPVHVVVRTCNQQDKHDQQTVDCKLDAPYVLIGGGGKVNTSGVFLTESRPLDNHTWRASSQARTPPNPHTIVVTAIGLRLDGVSPVSLIQSIRTFSASSPSPVNHPSLCAGAPTYWKNLSGGALVSHQGPGQFLTEIDSECAASKDHIYADPATITLYQRRIYQDPIDGFGALDVQTKSVTSPSVNTGIGGIQSSIDNGWALAAVGGKANYNGAGRMLSVVEPYTYHAARALSRDDVVADSGTTETKWTQIRKQPGSHSLCVTGGPLASDGDCAGYICQRASTPDPYCCSTEWDGICVSEVNWCGFDCGQKGCSAPSYQPAVWSSYLNVNNCYSYANNVRQTGGSFPAPGLAAGRIGGYGSCADLKAAIVADGLISINSKTDACTEGRSRVAYALTNLQLDQGFDYHFYRQDTNANDNNWSQKDGSGSVTNVDTTGQLITDPAVAASRYNKHGTTLTFCGYACTCSSSTEGQGHAIIGNKTWW